MDRRSFLLGGASLAGARVARAQTAADSRRDWFDVRSYGAAGTSAELATAAINRAVAACASAAGGVVYVGPGLYRSGTVVLRSNVTLYLEAGATLVASRDLKDYTPVAPGGSGVAPARHLILARDAENVAIAGPGRIDGQGEAFWSPVVPATPEEPAREIEAHYWRQLERPSPLVEFAGCRNVRVESVRIDNAPGWTLRTVNCDRVQIRGISMLAPMVAAGIVITGCRDVTIADCILNTGDDTICLKSENPYGDTIQPIRNVAVTNCILRSYYDGFKIGSATHGSVENISFSNSVIDGAGDELRRQALSGLAIEMVDGGSVAGVTMSNIRMGRVRSPIFIRLGNRTPRADGGAGVLRDVAIDGVHASGAMLPCVIAGLEKYPVRDVSLTNIRVHSDVPGSAASIDRTVPEAEAEYPETLMFGPLPAHGLYCRHAHGIRMRELVFEAAEELRPALFAEDVEALDVSGLRAARSPYPRGVIHLKEVREAMIGNCTSPSGAETFLEIRGTRSHQVRLLGNALEDAAIPVRFSEGAGTESVEWVGARNRE